MEFSLVAALLGPAQSFEDFCAYLSNVVGFEVDRVSRAASTLMLLSARSAQQLVLLNTYSYTCYCCSSCACPNDIVSSSCS